MEKRLTADLNVVSNSNLEIQLLDGDLNIIQKLDDEPNDVGGLTSAELKAKFDESGNIIKKYINETLIPAVLADDATEESRKQAEAARVAAEQGRVTAEEGRVSAESGRVSAEQARANAEASRVSAETARVQAETARADETAGIVARATAQANAAAGSASQAAGSEQAAQSAANTATSAASSASQSAAAASGSASQAQASAAAAAQSAASVDGVNKTAQSWAVGGTGTRPGEDTDNAKYWAQQAQTAVGGDFATKTEAQGYVDTHNQSVNAHADIRAAVAGSVRYDAAQSLSDAQQEQARGNINAAPGGFGWGNSVGQFILDANEAILGGFYYWGPDAKNTPFRYGAMVVIPRSSSTNKPNITQIASQDTGDFTPHALIAVRKSTDSGDGMWGPWEWVNPPMELGTEYRTTERYMRKPVYIMAFSFGALPNASDKAVAMPGTDGTCKIIEIHGYASNEMTLPGVSGVSEALQVTLTGIGNTAYVKTGADRSSATATIVAKYFKTTD